MKIRIGQRDDNGDRPPPSPRAHVLSGLLFSFVGIGFAIAGFVGDETQMWRMSVVAAGVAFLMGGLVILGQGLGFGHDTVFQRMAIAILLSAMTVVTHRFGPAVSFFIVATFMVTAWIAVARKATEPFLGRDPLAHVAQEKVLGLGCFGALLLCGTVFLYESRDELFPEETPDVVETGLFPEKAWNWGTGIPVTAIDVAPHGPSVLVAHTDGSLHFKSAETGITRRSIHGHDAAITALALSRDEETALSGDANGVLVLNRPRDRNVEPLVLVRGTRPIAAVVLSSGGDVGISAVGADVTVWDVESGEVRKRLESLGGNVLALALSTDDRCLAGGSDDGSIVFWEVVSWGIDNEAVVTSRFSTAGDAAVSALAWSADGHLAVGRADGSLVLFRDFEPVHQLAGHRLAIRGLAFSADSQLLFSVSGDDDDETTDQGTVGGWKTTSGELDDLFVLTDWGYNATDVAVAPHRRDALLVGTNGGAVLKLDLRR